MLSKEETLTLSIGERFLTHSIQYTVRIIRSLVKAFFDQLMILVSHFLLSNLPLKGADTRVRLAKRVVSSV